MRKYLAISLIGASALAASAQFNQSISVDGKYVPEIFRLDRINTFPRQVKFSLDANPLNYDGKSVPAGFAPTLLPMPATAWNANHDFSDSRGYLELGAGSWLNSTLSAGYRFIDDKSTTLGFRLQHNSTSLWKPDMSEFMKDTKMYRYDESLGIYGAHSFDGVGKLTGAIDWHIGNFNYYGYDPQFYRFANLLWDGGMFANTFFDLGNATAPKAPTQTLNDISVRFLWESPASEDNLTWKAGAGVRYFGYRSYYAPDLATLMPQAPVLMDVQRISGGRETNINLNGSMLLPMSGTSSFGVDLNADILLYAHNETLEATRLIWNPDNYGLVTITPYYRFTRDRLLVNIGADIDLAFNAGRMDEASGYARYGFLHVAPDIKLDYLAGPVSFYLHALGGSRLNTLANNYELDYYQAPALGNTRPIYSPLDGSLGVTFGPFSGFSAGADFAFRVSRGEYIGGWYQTYLNYQDWTIVGLPQYIFEDGMNRPLSYSYSNANTYNLSGISIGARASYDAGKIFKIEAKGNYKPQNGTKGYFNGYDRPRWTALVSAETNPWNTLKFKVSYEYRGVRNIYAIGSYAGALISDCQAVMGYRLPDLTYLNIGASYGISRNCSIWLQADNILNRHDELLPMLPTQGVRIAGGLNFRF